MSFEFSSITGSVAHSSDVVARQYTAQNRADLQLNKEAVERADLAVAALNEETGDVYIRTYVDNAGYEDTASEYFDSKSGNSDSVEKYNSKDKSKAFRLPGSGSDRNGDSSDSSVAFSGKTGDSTDTRGIASTDRTSKDQKSSEEATSQDNLNILKAVTSGSADVKKLSASERAALVRELKYEQQLQQEQFIKMIRGSIGMQATAFVNANAVASVDDAGVWKFIASGNYTVSAETQEAARQAISEEGFYGVNQTSNRLFQMAVSMAGGDSDVMRSLQNAILVGFHEAQKDWGRELPTICQDTLKATNKLFDDYYSKQEAGTDDAAKTAAAATDSVEKTTAAGEASKAAKA